MKRAAGLLLICLFSAGCASIAPPKDIKSEQLVKTTASWNGQALPAYPGGSPEITILKITIPPHQTLPLHKHTCINAGVLLKGQLTVIAENGDKLRMKPFDPIVELVNTWHYGSNEGAEPAEILVFYAGEKDKPFTVIKSKEQYD